MDYAYYSNLAIVSAVVVYLLAMFAHAAEWGAARKVDDSAAMDQLIERELVGASVGVAADDAIGSGSVANPAGAQRASDERGPGHGRGDSAEVSARVETFGRIGVALTVVGLLLSITGVVFRGIAAQRAPWGNMYEFTISAMMFAVAAYLILSVKWKLRWLGLPITLLAAIANGLAATVFYVAVAPLVPALHSVWFLIHIVAAAISGAAFNVGGLASILYLIKKRAENKGRVRGYLAWLPPTQRIDVLAYRVHAFAFPLWTFTVAAGAIWAEYAWGRYWGWDPKETWALVTWVIYAGYLHARSTAGWKGTKAAVIAVIGLVSFWFNFIGINLLVSGLHSYAGV